MKFTLSVIHRRTKKLSPVVRLQDHWWTNYRKGSKAMAMLDAVLCTIGMLKKNFTPLSL
jgi:hypothetical protein